MAEPQAAPASIPPPDLKRLHKLLVGRVKGTVPATRAARQIVRWAGDVLEFVPELGEEDLYELAFHARRQIWLEHRRRMTTTEVLAKLLAATGAGLLTLRVREEADG